MKTQSKAQVVKVTNNAKNKKTSIVPFINKEVKAVKVETVKKDVKQSDYYKQVIETNKRLKSINTSLGGCRAMLLNNADAIQLNPLFVALLEKSKKQENYKLFLTLCRVSKSGNYSPFYVLQCLKKNVTILQEKFI